MTLNDRIKRFKRAIARWGLRGTSFVLTRLPFSVVSFLTRVLTTIGLLFTVKQKKIAAESLKIAFGDEKSPKEVRQIFKKCFTNVGKMMIELIYFMDHPKMIKERVSFENKEVLDKAFSKGKGVIAVSAHFGNFPLMLLRFAQEGYETNAIIRQTRDKKIEKHFQQLRTKLGLKTLYSHPRQKCVTDSLKALRKNEFLFIPLDQNFGSGGGVFVDFFGQKAATATGPVVFAMRTGAPILPIFIVRQKDDTHKIIIDEPLYLEQGKDEKDTIFINVSRITKVIEKYIRKYPDEWGWMHRRWKSRPGE
ncbi:MAG: lysophospholipid acyltransferase family protein [Candidatus Aceula meridiana]|nr:lysophospholipid acyltransferase family protein [Candidatus Aceula meridiana]